MIYDSKMKRADYSYPLLGNGDIAFNPDYEGGVCKKDLASCSSGEDGIYRAGRRVSRRPTDRWCGLLKWGSIEFEGTGKARAFT